MSSNEALRREAAEALTEAAFRTGDFARAERVYAEALAVAMEGGALGAQASSLVGLGMVLHYRSIGRLQQGLEAEPWDVAAEEGRFRAALALAREAGAEGAVAAALFGLGLVHQVFHGDWTTALPRFREGLQIVEAQGADSDRELLAELHRHLGFFHLVVEGRAEVALPHLRRSLELRRELDDPRRLPSALEALAGAEAAAGNRDRAVTMLQDALAGARAVGLRPEWVAGIQRSLDDLVPSPPGAPAAADGVTGELLDRIWDLQGRAWDRFHAHASELQLTEAEAKALQILSTSTPYPMRALATALHQDPSNLTVVVDRLEHRDIVERRRLADKRMRGVVLTRLGAETREKLRRAMASDHPMLEGLGAPERQALLDLLRAQR